MELLEKKKKNIKRKEKSHARDTGRLKKAKKLKRGMHKAKKVEKLKKDMRKAKKARQTLNEVGTSVLRLEKMQRLVRGTI